MVSNYEKNMFKQLQNALLKIDELSEKVKKIEIETENKYLKIIYEKDLEIARLKTENAELKERIVKLETETDRLRKQISNDSNNSSNPPSTDMKPNAPNTYNGRSKTGKKSGGQKGHSGKHLSRSTIEEKIKSGQISHEIVNHGKHTGSYTSKYVLDLRFNPVAVEHRFYGDVQIPKAFKVDVQYGNEIKAVVAMLSGQGLVASNRIACMISSMSNGAIELSDGTIYNFLGDFNTKAQPYIENIKTELLNNAVLGVDETGGRVNAKNMFFRNYSDEKRVLYTANETKGKKAIEDDNVLPRFVGTLVHDHNTVNYNYGTGNGECNVHLIRYLRANSDNTHHNWSDDMILFLLSLKRSKEIAKSFMASKFEQSDIENYQKRYDEIVTEGFSVLKTTKSIFYQKEEKKLLKRLKKYRDNHLLFASNFDVPFDNNLSERDLRMVKTKGKVSGCFRSLDGAKIFANLMSVIKTAIKQNISPLIALRSVFCGRICLG